MTEGLLRGCQAVIMRPAEPFPFLKLPAELRNRIYRKILTLPATLPTPRAMSLWPDSSLPKWQGLHPSPSIRFGALEPYGHGGYRGGRPRVTCATSGKLVHLELAPAMLRTNKQIYAEAAPVLYSGNSFHFAGHSVSRRWLKRIGRSRA